ncbi:MAG: hypothetical protein PsegKO_21090 [Pseudohongiellaceae bacterium]
MAAGAAKYFSLLPSHFQSKGNQANKQRNTQQRSDAGRRVGHNKQDHKQLHKQSLVRIPDIAR